MIDHEKMVCWPTVDLLVEISEVKVAKPTIEKVENHKNWLFLKIWSKGRIAFGIGAKHI